MACLITAPLPHQPPLHVAQRQSGLVTSTSTLYLTYLIAASLMLVSCQSADSEHQTRLITSKRPHPAASPSSADALPHDSELAIQTETTFSATPADPAYPSIAHIKATLGQSTQHSAAALSSTDTAVESPSATSTTTAAALATTSAASVTSSTSSSASSLLSSTAAGSTDDTSLTTTCEALLASAAAPHQDNLPAHERTWQPSLIFTGYPLAASFTLDESAEFFQATNQNLAASEGELAGDSPMNTVAIKTQSMTVQLSSHLRGELMQFHPHDNAASVALDFLDDQSLTELDYLQIHWKAVVEIGASHLTDEGDLRQRLATMLTSLLNHNVALNLNETIQLQPQELNFTNPELLTSAVIAKDSHNVVFTELIATAPLDQALLYRHRPNNPNNPNNVTMAATTSCADSLRTQGKLRAQASPSPSPQLP